MDENTEQLNNSHNNNSNKPADDQRDQKQNAEASGLAPTEPGSSESSSSLPESTGAAEQESQPEASSGQQNSEPPNLGGESGEDQPNSTQSESVTPEQSSPLNSNTESASAQPAATEPQPVQSTSTEASQPPTLPENTNSGSTVNSPPNKSKRFPAITLLIIFVVALAAIGAGGYLYYKHKHNAPKPVSNLKVGLMMAFSGGSSAMGFGTSKGVALAKKQLNADNVSVVEADSQCDPKAAVTAINSLIKQHVVAIIGDGCSSASLAALPIANNAQIPMISPSASSTKLSIPNDYFYRVIPNDNHQGSFMANTVYNDGIRKVAVFYTNEPYGASIEQAFQNSFESLGGKVVATAFSQPNVIDLSSQINTLKAANPQAIFFAPNSVLTGIAAVKLARQAGITVPFYGADVFYDQTIISNAASDVEGMTFTTFPTGTTTFKQALANAYPNATQLYAAPEAYDAFKAIYLAIQKGATTGLEIKNTLPSIKFQGVSAYVSFDQNGDLAVNSGYQYALFQVKKGQFVQLN